MSEQGGDKSETDMQQHRRMKNAAQSKNRRLKEQMMEKESDERTTAERELRIRARN